MEPEITTSAPAADVSATEPSAASSPSEGTYRIPGTNRYSTANAAGKTTSAGPEGTPPAGKEEKADVPQRGSREWNHQNAQRRINATNEKYKAKIAELEESNRKLNEQLQSLTPDELSKADAISREIDKVQTQSEVYNTMIEQAELTEFENRVAEAYPDAKDQFMEATYRYAPYVNKHEPELKAYIARPFGMIVLNEWYKRMDHPQYRNEWLNFTAYEKGQALAGFYQQIEGVARRLASGEQMDRPNIPAAKGGRQSNAIVPGDDFGLALQNAKQQFRR